MSVQSKDQIREGFQAIVKGIDSGIAPNLLPRDQLAFAVNCTFRTGFPETRPGWVKRTITFASEEDQSNFEDNLFQGASTFERRNMLTAMIGGRLFAIKLDRFNLLDVSIPGDLNPSNRWRAYSVTAEDFNIWQDGQSAPLIFDGASSRRADSDGVSGVKELPTGTLMAYSQGRLVVANVGRTAFMAGNLVYSSQGTSLYGYRDAILKFDENDFYNGGGEFGLPSTAGLITAMQSVNQIDTSTGQGPLQVFSEYGSSSVILPPDRTQWQNTNFPIQSVSLLGSGPTSERSLTVVNGDLWYRASDGVRSFYVARREFNTWTNRPLSHEVEVIINRDDRNLLSYSSGCIFDNRLLITAAPQRVWNHGVVHPGLMVLDFLPLASLAGDGAPVWEGAWSGLRILQVLSGIFSGVERCFAFALNSDNQIELWELTRDQTFDDTGTEQVAIPCSIETPSYNGGETDGGWDLKQLNYGDIWYDRLSSHTEFEVEYRPDQHPNWQAWHSWESCAEMENCLTASEATGCAGPPSTLVSQYRGRVRFPGQVGRSTCDEITKRPYGNGYEFQCRLSWTGYARIKKFRIFMNTNQPEPNVGSCETLI